MSDVAEVARGLTKSQQEEILYAKDMLSNHGGYPFFTVQLTRDPWPQGIAQFLTLRTDRLTPLGLAVRQYLQENPNA